MTPARTDTAGCSVRGCAPDEGIRVFVHEHDRDEIYRRLVCCIAEHEALPADGVRILSVPGAAPQVEIAGETAGKWRVSFGDTAGCVIGAVSRIGAVGVDVEWIDPLFGWKAVAAEFFPRQGVDRWQRQEDREGRREFFRAWSRWEAALKCRQTGFRPGHAGPSAAEAGLAVRELDVGPQHVAWLALEAGRIDPDTSGAMVIRTARERLVAFGQA